MIVQCCLAESVSSILSAVLKLSIFRKTEENYIIGQAFFENLQSCQKWTNGQQFGLPLYRQPISSPNQIKLGPCKANMIDTQLVVLLALALALASGQNVETQHLEWNDRKRELMHMFLFIWLVLGFLIPFLAFEFMLLFFNQQNGFASHSNGCPSCS